MYRASTVDSCEHGAWGRTHETPTPMFKLRTWGTLYDVVGSVKGHEEGTSREGSFFSSLV
jgi:hypothetical protein